MSFFSNRLRLFIHCLQFGISAGRFSLKVFCCLLHYTKHLPVNLQTFPLEMGNSNNLIQNSNSLGFIFSLHRLEFMVVQTKCFIFISFFLFALIILNQPELSQGLNLRLEVKTQKLSPYSDVQLQKHLVADGSLLKQTRVHSKAACAMACTKGLKKISCIIKM